MGRDLFKVVALDGQRIRTRRENLPSAIWAEDVLLSEGFLLHGSFVREGSATLQTGVSSLGRCLLR